MERSSANEKPLPPGVDATDLVDGPTVVSFASGRATMLPPTPAERETEMVQIAQGPASPPAPVPAAANLIRPAPAIAAPVTVTMPVTETDYSPVIALALDVLAAKLHALIALVTACLIWAFVIFDPLMWRIVAAGVFSGMVLLPVLLIWWRALGHDQGG